MPGKPLIGYFDDDVVDTVNGVPYKWVHKDKNTSDKNKGVVWIAGTILSAFS